MSLYSKQNVPFSDNTIYLPIEWFKRLHLQGRRTKEYKKYWLHQSITELEFGVEHPGVLLGTCHYIVRELYSTGISS